MIPTRSITEPSPATSNLITILLQMSKQLERQDKQWGDIHKQLGKQFSEAQKESRESIAPMSQKFADSQKESREQFAASQKENADKFTEALKVSGKPKFKRIEPMFSPKRDIDDPSLYRRFKIDFDHFIADIDPAN